MVTSIYICYKTSDGKLFENRDEAEAHEREKAVELVSYVFCGCAPDPLEQLITDKALRSAMKLLLDWAVQEEWERASQEEWERKHREEEAGAKPEPTPST